MCKYVKNSEIPKMKGIEQLLTILETCKDFAY